MTTNRLNGESSPYLRQHADNPVHWAPWDAAALEAARELDRPILLSIGYSSCHWCHVMAHESFEDDAVAAVMNDHFVNIKVDREERPDLDKTYQLAHQLLTQKGGGWPLTMFLDPQTLVPFFGGTYFPKTARYGLPGFVDLLLRVKGTFDAKRDELDKQGEQVQAALASLVIKPADPMTTDDALLKQAADELAQQFDRARGGFGGAPKFPMPATVGALLRHWARTASSGDADRDALEMVMTTLTKIARGGIYDHVGGGFYRYATDADWAIPHFEKMLYDNGQLLELYAAALRVGGDRLFEDAIVETVDWLVREMRDPSGGFYAALDADSEGQEGAFYVWRRPDVKRLLDEDEYLLVETLYGLDKPANFEGKWHLRRLDAWRAVVERLSLEAADADRTLAAAKQKLAEARASRVRPARDDKVLTAWNGLALAGLADAAVVLDRPQWLELATELADYLRGEAWQDGVLYATWTDGTAKQPAFLDDYAFVLRGLGRLLMARWRDEDVRFAIALADGLIERFQDIEGGGFFFTAHDQETVLHRAKPTVDDALPPGNGIAAQALLQLGHLLANTTYLDAAHCDAQLGTWRHGRLPVGARKSPGSASGHAYSARARVDRWAVGRERVLAASRPRWVSAQQACVRDSQRRRRAAIVLTRAGKRAARLHLQRSHVLAPDHVQRRVQSGARLIGAEDQV